ncbi:peptide deformylase [Candidatus Shapirobacteria bacterium CG03_land_8_20_14_0_80_39_12]|uniref:Peptide deformylase n=1 Tax=Candidatus Shapirobacteria bacterium CG03_land_8_20_14_0_80_39_12 TaxID=1974879 RepID=A0A2M7BDE6_9BACT|nr:MAG: peptide deformylase [Candidatus Shapirobacteria bacterium CG03_land_8_20_14_0_80_39_12]
MAKIITVPNHKLREISKPVLVDKKTLELIKELKQTLLDSEEKMIGVGLAAVQIGVLKQVFLAYSPNSKKLLTFINPEIIWFSQRMTDSKKSKFEGCLSVPGRWAIIKRSKEVKIKYQTEGGKEQVRKFSGMMAIEVQHEYDHLKGILFIDRALEQKAKIYEMVKDEEDKEYLREVQI